MNKITWILGLGLVGLLSACGGDAAKGKYIGDYITRTDFEDLPGWGTDFNALTRERAHSGRFAIFVNATHEYSLTFRLPLRDASVHQVKAIDVEAWVLVPSKNAGSSLTVQLGRPIATGDPSPLFNEQLPLLEQVHEKEYGKWTKIQHTFVLPADAPAESELRIFLWRESSPDPVYLDDLVVKARE